MLATDFKPLRISAPDRRLCFWGAPARVLEEGDYPAKLKGTGANTGNLFIGHGLFHNTDCAEKRYFPGMATLAAEKLHEQFDTVFIPASNFVNTSLDLEPWYDYFSCSKVGLFCFGLGSQLLPDQEAALKPGTERFLRLLGERSGSIGVRGTFTAEVMWKLGIRNVSIVGCPSLMNLTTEAMARLASGRPALDKVALNFSNNVRSHSISAGAMRTSENALFQRMLSERAFYVLQNETPEMEVLAAVKRGESSAAQAALSRIAALFEVAATRADVRQALEQRMRVFFSVEEWIGCMRSMTASVGTRFHGNIAALLAGTPALFLVHDMRTLELCELLRVPHLVLDRPRTAESIVERLLECDYGPFRQQVSRLQTEWKLFLARNGLSAAQPAMSAPDADAAASCELAYA